MRKYLLYFSLVVAPVVMFCFAFSCWSQMTYGDLTRIGNWTERDFGPTSLQPIININANGKSILASDVAVLGDSFTIQNRWQSVVESTTGYKIKSYQYNQNCIAQWVKSVTSDRAVKVVIIETVERVIAPKFGNLPLCENKHPIPLEIHAQRDSTSESFFPTTISFSYLLASAKNMWKLHEHPGDTFSDNGVINTPLRPDCALFSNRRNNRLLYYAEDDLKEQWSKTDIANAIANMIQIRDAVQRSGKRFILVIAPDKSSIYLDCITSRRGIKHSSDIARLMINAGIDVPDLRTTFAGNKRSIIDLYDPNNTHWSRAGYILAGNELGKYIAERMH